jgi:L-amino acid N-acyltransferase YncA
MIEIKTMEPQHWNEVKRIYEEGLSTGNATFQTSAPEWEEWDKAHIQKCRLIALDNGKLVGWAALSSVSDRCAYGGVAEVSVYVSNAARGKGIGKELLQNLIEDSESNQFWTLQAGIFPENKASIRIHEENGFRIIGTREKIGKMKGVWRDTLILERRSNTVGV